ncbi:DUF262 domain-containing protein [Helicobacter pylori]|uniref:DUF262 domain-containing protein n=1 Tax=Helicobacter pylori TaxID=210 RepID=UPI000FDEB4FF|nr:DUF262 domain-containing protein [Helicobacter pylori]RVY60708.1 DUF262 domain-containing protein [Helicobacter pylori]RVZ76186.1 DUF262 domain-containing protein [Helicobacter pylori]
MKAGEATLLRFFEENQNNQFVIPIYQRLYSWKKEQCEQLWDDIIKTGGNDQIEGHFIGSILYVLDGNTPSSPLLIIDGQQRLTTITLLFIALRNHSSDEVKRKEIESYLINSNKDGDKKFRLILSESDKDTLLSLIDENKRKPSEPSLKIMENFKLFEEWIRKNTDKLETIFKGLDKLMIVWIALKKGKDDPQLIFESMNSKGIELTQADLIRNYIVMETEVKKQEDFYNQYWRAMEENFGSLTGNQKFPNDFEFKDSFITKELYGRNKTKKKKTKYFLERLENFDTKEPVNTQECTIEHIMPQTLNLEWERDLGENFEAIHEKYLNTIGNLTLTGYNEKYSNNSFQEKRDMEKGFKQSPLRLNQSLKDLESFGEKEIEKRANDLVDWALKIWTYPKLDAETLEKYKPKKEKKVYDLSSYKFGSHSRELFDILRKEIKALDERVTEKFNQDYISYMFDKNFVDIVVQTKDLKLYLNMPFNELQDEKNLARDMTNKGHLGNGDIEIKLETKENIPYCLGLIKQALEKQMGGRNRQ